MKPFGIGLGTVLLRFYLMMLVVIAAGFTGQWWLATLALPIFLSIMLGVSFKREKNESEAKMRTLTNIGAKAERKVS